MVPVVVALGGGLFSLLQAAGVIAWVPRNLFDALNAPALALAGILIKGERSLLLIPWTIPAQWLLVGLVLGILLSGIRPGKPGV